MAVSETIVREYFELHGLFVRQQRKHIAPRREDDEIDFYVHNPNGPPEGSALPFVLGSRDLGNVTRAVIVVKAWHTEVFSQAVLANAPEIFRFASPETFKRATDAFGSPGPLAKLLVIPALPTAGEARQQSIELLRAKGIDGIIEFRTMLSDLINHIEINRNYQKSDLLQVIRILKNYNLFASPQMELFDLPSGGRRSKN
ncbi:MAG: hypothetical protein CMO74_00475 [Verrucomicrobiales bacterium]|nr:hypothetical protein [Verrucomicrobiales bacterium]